MALVVGGEIVGTDILYAPFVYVARRDMAGFDQLTQPRGGERVDLVVIGGHPNDPSPVVNPASPPSRVTSIAQLSWAVSCSSPCQVQPGRLHSRLTN